ncbi:MAG: branched-chain amino acid ABC transporter permease [Actinobacteria bacterium]|nr:branched-chain amino acid ABC transporter permease [Actinomycetota bacterium]
MEFLLTVLLSGVQNGLLYALVGLAFVLIFRVTGTINLALGESAVLGALLGYTLVVSLGLPLWTGVLGVAVAGGAIGAATDMLLIRRMRSRSPLRVLVLSFGLALVLQNLWKLFWSTDIYSLPQFPGVPKVFTVFFDRSVVPGQALYVTLLAAVVFGAWAFVLWRTAVGRDMRAVSSDAEVATAVGINARRTVTGAHGIAFMLVAVVGFVVSPVLFLNYAGGTLLAVKGLVATLVGGIHRPFGALVGGLLLGIAEAATAGYYSADWKEVAHVLLHILVLLVRPNGILASSKEQH